MRILFAGTPNIAVTVLGGLVNLGHDVVGVLTREDAFTGRKRTKTPSPVADFATSKGIPVLKANNIDAATLVEISDLQADLAIVVAYGSILKSDALNLLPTGWFNLHFSLLPEYRGAAPVQHALLNGESETGVTLFQIDQGLDTGKIVGQLSTRIEPDEDAGRLLQRLAHLGLTLLSEKLPLIYSGLHTLEPQVGQVSVAPKISRADAKLDFSKDAETVHNKVRAMNPEPMAWASLAGEAFRVIASRPCSGDSTLAPGSIIRTDRAPVVVCSNGTYLELLEVQPAGKKPMSGADWIRGQQKLEGFN
jgi:methionyl-tRNA formyltransferase